MALPLAVVAWALGRPDLSAWAVLALLLWELQETLRRAFVAQLRPMAAVPGDALSYLGQALVVWLVLPHTRLTLEAVFIAMAATSGLAVVVQFAQFGIRLVGRSEVARFAASTWRLGRWILFTTAADRLILLATGWSLAFAHGAGAAAEIQAVSNVLGVTHPILFGVAMVITPAAATGYARSGFNAARSAAMRFALQGAILLVPYWAAVALWPDVVLRLFYGESSPYLGLIIPLRLVVASYVLSYVTISSGALLSGLRANRQVFLAQLAGGLVVTTFVILPLVAFAGVVGAAIGSAVAAGTSAALNLIQVRRVKGRLAVNAPLPRLQK
jgi:Na+-driven multidrug efflux pump